MGAFCQAPDVQIGLQTFSSDWSWINLKRTYDLTFAFNPVGILFILRKDMTPSICASSCRLFLLIDANTSCKGQLRQIRVWHCPVPTNSRERRRKFTQSNSNYLNQHHTARATSRVGLNRKMSLNPNELTISTAFELIISDRNKKITNTIKPKKGDKPKNR